MRGKIIAGVVGGLIAGLIAWLLVVIISVWGTWPRLVTTPVFREVGPLAALLAFWGLSLFLALKAPRADKAWQSVLVMCAILFFAVGPTGLLIQLLVGVFFTFGGPILGLITLTVALAAGTDVDEATRLNNQGLLSYAQEFYEEAESLFLQALAIREKKLGREHVGVATILDNLAETYQAQGRYAEAEPLYKRALGIREKDLRPVRPDVDRTVKKLAALYRAQGETEKTEQLLRDYGLPDL